MQKVAVTSPLQGEPRSIFNASYGVPDTGATHRAKPKPPKKLAPAKPAKSAAEGMWGDMLR
ncbi:hypothetical protein [Falsirhodobacter sp. 1013]|uniref:hypothetical protein n=1 Tax=Falsirhodobacter sp. 1013 TaxID=3417566 RepID=UPI003EBD28CE